MMLIDSNLIIYATQPQHHRLRGWLVEHASHYSAISRLEALGYRHLSAAEKQAIINVPPLSERGVLPSPMQGVSQFPPLIRGGLGWG